MAKKKKVTKKPPSTREKKIDLEQIMLSNRCLFLFDVVTDKVAHDIVKRLIVLDRINHNPILLYINSPGGSISDGFSIIDTMKGIQSPIFTYIIGSAYSMGGIIAIAGDQRIMSQNSLFMVHDGSAGHRAKFQDLIDYGKHLEKLQSHMFRFLRNHTKLTEAELIKAKGGQLWLNAEERHCLKVYGNAYREYMDRTPRWIGIPK